MRNKANVVNTIPPSADYPFGRLKDDTGINDGTPICEENNGDIQETVTFFMNRAKITPNGLPDNVNNGYQIGEAIREVGGKFDSVHNMEFISGKMKVDVDLSNVYLDECLMLIFNYEDDYKQVGGISTVIDSKNNEYNAILTPDFDSNFFNNGLYFIQKKSNYFEIYAVAAKSVLSNIYEKIDYLEVSLSKSRQFVLPLNPITIPSTTFSLPFTLPEQVFQNILSWEIVWETYYTDGGNSLVSYESNKTKNLAANQSIMLGRFTNTQTTGFIKFEQFQGIPLGNPKLIVTYQPQ